MVWIIFDFAGYVRTNEADKIVGDGLRTYRFSNNRDVVDAIPYYNVTYKALRSLRRAQPLGCAENGSSETAEPYNGQILNVTRYYKNRLYTGCRGRCPTSSRFVRTWRADVGISPYARTSFHFQLSRQIKIMIFTFPMQVIYLRYVISLA